MEIKIDLVSIMDLNKLETRLVTCKYCGREMKDILSYMV
jgi:hypothetical protein